MKRITELFLNDNVMLVLVIINTSIMYIGGFFFDLRELLYADSIFTILFLVEAAVKISKQGWSEYWCDGWNKFDFILLLFAMPSLLWMFSNITLPTNILLSLRAFRTFKSFRLFQFVPNIESLLRGVKLACKASLVVAIGFVVFLLVFSIVTSTLFGEYAPEEFGNPLISTYSTFRLFTIEGWYELPETIAVNSSPVIGNFARIYFSVLLFCGGIIGMSLINSIFVDAMAADNNDDIKDELNELKAKLDEISQAIKKPN